MHLVHNKKSDDGRKTKDRAKDWSINTIYCLDYNLFHVQWNSKVCLELVANFAHISLAAHLKIFAHE